MVGWGGVGSCKGGVGHIGVGSDESCRVGGSCRGGVCYLEWVGHAGVGWVM